MSKEKLLQQCCKYFKGNIGFKRPLTKIKEKYISLGKLGGIIRLNNLSLEEQEALTGFLKKNCYKDSISIKVQEFEKALEATPYANLNFIDILNKYFGKEILSNKEKQNIYEREREEFFNKLLEALHETKAYDWIRYTLSTQKNAYRIIIQKYNENKSELEKALIKVANALNSLTMINNEKERLAIFASNITKNPHGFDNNTFNGRLLIYGITYVLDRDYPQSSEERTELLFEVGLVSDEISNYTVCAGLLAYKGDKIHYGWKGFYDSGEPLQVSLWNLTEIDSVVSYNKRVFVFENPTVFSEVLYRTREHKPSLLCSNGQVKLATLILLDRLTQNNIIIYYSGDFDPEGLRIADKLKKRYRDKLFLWRFTEEDYFKSISKEKIDSKRINKLDNLEYDNLIRVGKLIKEKGYSGYQELLINDLIEDISKG